MIIAIVHNQSLQVIAKYEATDSTDAGLQYLKSHPELECETLPEFYQNYPVLAQSLLCIPLH
jgi:hypothetical protein